MYEELIQALRLHCEAGKKIGLSGAIWTLLDDASTALKSMTAQLTTLQAENAEKDRENERLKSELLEAREDYMASEMEREQGVDALARVKAERDAAQKEIERMKDIMRQHGIMVIPGKHPGSRPEWNISRGAQGEG